METLHLIILILHVVGSALILGSFFCALLMLSRKDIGKEVYAAAFWLGEIIGPLLGVQLLTGIYLVWSEADKMAHNPLVWAKFALFVLLGVFSGIAFKTDKRLKGENAEMPKLVQMWRLNTGLCVALLFLIVILGVIVAETAA